MHQKCLAAEDSGPGTPSAVLRTLLPAFEDDGSDTSTLTRDNVDQWLARASKFALLDHLMGEVRGCARRVGLWDATCLGTPALRSRSQPSFLPPPSTLTKPPSPLLLTVLDQVRAIGQRMVVVSNSTQVLDLIEALCNVRKYGLLRLDGQTSSDKRQPMVPTPPLCAPP